MLGAAEAEATSLRPDLVEGERKSVSFICMASFNQISALTLIRDWKSKSVSVALTASCSLVSKFAFVFFKTLKRFA